MSRAAILASMLGGVTPPLGDDEKKHILSAMEGFSDTQLKKMDQAGVRIWPFITGIPLEYQIAPKDLSSPADYHYQTRVIRVSPASLKNGPTDFLRHELAHAWDDVRNEKKLNRLRGLKGDALAKELNRRAREAQPFESQSAKKLPPGNTMTMQEMLDRYRKVLPDKTKSFANPHTADRHNATNVMEFYAEGYSVFHGHNTLSQARLMWLAPELFDHLEHESKQQGLKPPSREALKKVLDENEKGWRSY